MITYVLIFFAGVFNAIMDKIQFHWSKSVFDNIEDKKIRKWCDPKISHKNKWKNGNKEEGEVFLGSSTVFVFVTDLWHFCQFLMLTCIMLAIVLYGNYFSLYFLIDFVILRIIFSIGFTIFWDKFLNKRQKDGDRFIF